MEPSDVLLYLLLPGFILVHLVVTPYTKVEESFNIQAIHDVLAYGTPTTNIYHRLSSTYDHFSFPGAVPRTFIGPVLLAAISQPLVSLFGFDHGQFMVRAMLGLFNAASLLVFARNLARAYGRDTARWYLLLQMSQFHVIFYASRTLPNMFAFGLTTSAFAFLLPHPNPRKVMPRQGLAMAMFVLAGVIFRAEIALLLATTALYLLVTRRTSIRRLIVPCAVSVVVALAISVPVDSYFWQKPVWPELWGFYYNAILGSSSAWGTSPWHYYFVSALPRLLLNPLAIPLLIPLSLLHPATASAARGLVVPTLLFVAIYSAQPHKEARFIFYVVPPLTASAALGANFLFNRRTKSAVSAMLALAVALSVLVSLVASTAMLLLSALNYPGGEALAHLGHLIKSAAATGTSASVVPVHADVLACMTGVTLFGTATSAAMPDPFAVGGRRTSAQKDGLVASQKSASVAMALDKTENDPVLLTDAFWSRFDYVLAERPDTVKGGEWAEVGVVQGLAGIEILRPSDAPGGSDTKSPIVGNGAVLAAVRDSVRKLTRGWWLGPKMAPRIHILRRIKDSERTSKAMNS